MANKKKTPEEIRESFIRWGRRNKEMRRMDREHNALLRHDNNEALAWKVIHFWNSQPGLRTHCTTKMTQTLKRAIKLIHDAFNGKLVVQSSKNIVGKKYRMSHFMKAITLFNTVAVNPQYGEKMNEWAKAKSLDNFIKDTRTFNSDGLDEMFLLRLESPFIYMANYDIEAAQKNVILEDEKVLKTIFDIVYNYIDVDISFNHDLKVKLSYFVKWLKSFLKENEYGLSQDHNTIYKLCNEFCGHFYEDKKFSGTWVLNSKRWQGIFLQYCLNENIIHDERDGELFQNGTKFWFQLSNAERKKIIASERKEKEETAKYDKKVSVAKSEPNSEITCVGSFDVRNVKKSRVSRFKDEMRKKALARGIAGKFDAIWVKWIRETKGDEAQLNKCARELGLLFRKHPLNKRA